LSVVLVDKAEYASRIPELLEKLEVPIKPAKLEVGDYIIGDIAIERKTISDYISSMVSGRLSRQLYELSYNFSLSYLCVVGLVGEVLMERRVSLYAYISSLVGASLKRSPEGHKGQVITVNLENEYDFALFVKALYEKLRKPEPRLPPAPVRASSDPTTRAVHVLCSLPGIGEAKAKALLGRFGSLKAVLNATPSELAQVPGVSLKMAEEIYALINKEVVLGER